MFERLKHWLRRASPVRSAEPDNLTSPTERSADSAVSFGAGHQPASIGTPSLIVIDVRSEREFRVTAIDHAVNVPLPRLEQCIRSLVADTATPLVLYCASGARSGMGCTMLQQLGYSNVSNAGGLYAAAAQLQREIRR